MLNQDTKRKIDSARNILVGKVPDPKAQVEQITTALIYKFMDDMDKEAQELGGKARYFTNGYEKYSWTKLMDVKLGGHDRLNLYFEAVSSLGRNQHMPQIFRDIFGDKSLPPYRDPQTLSLFLKEINGFNFDHSEDLGDAYEYLLNVIGTSGEAGQFRTPRQIIDFIATAVDPKKGDTICDPACGTAGFLISAYKHILKQHDGLDDPEKTEKPLTPDEKKNLMSHFVGYDIDPGMVRIATVNMYLHNFPEPKIFEYDTLTYEDRWDETFDVILANPPFMTPKGGIRPHKRFSIQANRSEVLFVDYIADHLNLNGKAGVIVPEGIIFNNQVAYKNLRKKLVESCLIAVVSLPQGIFIKPGGKGNVKTGVLIFDKELAKKTKDVLFVKISNDGFDLGAQRRVIDKNDLPLASGIIKRYKSALKNGKDFKLDKNEKQIADVIAKEKIAENGDYNLTGERYKDVVELVNQKWPTVELGEVCNIEKGTSITKTKVTDGKIPVIAGGQQPAYYHNQSNREGKTITVSASGAYAGFVNYFDYPIFVSDCTTIKTKDEKTLLTDFVFSLLKSRQAEIYKFQNGAAQPHVYGKDLAKIKIPLPPLEIQEQIVSELESYQRVIDGARMVVESWKPSFWIDPEWEIAKLGDISERVTKGTTPTTAGFKFQDSGINFVKIESIDDNGYFIATKFAHIDQKCNEALKRSQLKEGDVLFSIAGALGRVALVNKDILPANTNQALAIITPKGNLNSKYLEEVLRSPLIFNKIDGLKVGMAQYNISLTQVSDFEIPLPSLEIQKQIVAKIEVERKIVEANKEMIEIYEQKISDVLSEV
jgi:type I restriction enzyme M protein